MAKRPRRNHPAAFKAKVALEAVKEKKTIADTAEIHDVHPIGSRVGGLTCSGLP